MATPSDGVDRRYDAAVPNPVATRLGLTVEHRFGGGSFAAARTAGGASVVFKVLPDHPGSASAEWPVRSNSPRPRAAGCPVPRFLQTGTVDGRVYTIQEFVAGAVPAILRLPHAEQLVQVWQRFAGTAEKANEDACEEGRARAEDIVTGLRTGTERMIIDHEVLWRSPDPRIRAVLEVAVEIGHRVEPGMFRFGDVVHGDFDRSNVLVDDDRVVAVSTGKVAAAVETMPDDVRRAVLALGALQRLTFAARTRPDLLEWALSTTTGLTRPQRHARPRATP
ncbi:hypothetical protein [Virgisporangium aurantiacum]|uniref:hypothetical protein n=1 Tax=Virgisporangium aurantiacum TaxID=175570 RepID=UPI0019527026|nr:hypothetical protein [Virgisporangium aurantiacum]